MINQQPRRERGAIAVVVAIAAVAVLGFGAAVLDGGMMYYAAAELQSASDSAALAGARVLASHGPTAAVDQAVRLAQANGLAPEQIVVSVDSAANTVTVSTRRMVTFGLARALGLTQAEVAKSAVAAAQSVAALRGAAPLGVAWQEFTFGQVYELKVGGGSGEQGWYGALDFGSKGGGASEYRRNLEYGWDGQLRVGDIVHVKTGNMSGPTRQGIVDRLNKCNRVPACTFSRYTQGCPRLMIVPIVSEPDDKKVRVLGFAGFFIEGIPGSGNRSVIRGRFVEFVAEGQAGSGAFFGARAFNLVR